MRCAAGQDVNLDVILDVPVTLSLEVGRTRLPIRSLLQLNQGSVVELERAAGEPLDVFVNGTLVAHGEVVVVNEKFGIRLIDVISPAERIRKLQLEPVHVRRTVFARSAARCCLRLPARAPQKLRRRAFAAPDVASSAACRQRQRHRSGHVRVAAGAGRRVRAWHVMLKRLRARHRRGANGIEVLAQTSLGAKERAVIVRVGDERLLLGVAQRPGHAAADPACRRDRSARDTDRLPETPNFASLLKKSLGR